VDGSSRGDAGRRAARSRLDRTWQGTLQLPNGKELRTVLKISKADGSNDARQSCTALTREAKCIPINPVTLQGSTVKMSMPGIGGSYEGKLDNWGAASIAGNWTQGPNPIALNLKRATAENCLGHS